MVQTDSITILSDSIARIPDSLNFADTLIVTDTVYKADTIPAIYIPPKGFEGLLHPSLPQTQDWTFLILLFFYGIMIFSLVRSSSMIVDTIKNFFQVKERSSIFSKTTLNDFRFRLFLVIFSIGVFSLYAYVINNPETSLFSFNRFLYFLLATSVFFGLKYIFFDIIGFVFLDSSALKIGKESYFNIISMLGIIIFPLLVFRIYVPYNSNETIELIISIVLILGYVLILIKLIQIFLHKILSLFYILLYLCTLEILPLIFLFKVYKLLI